MELLFTTIIIAYRFYSTHEFNKYDMKKLTNIWLVALAMVMVWGCGDSGNNPTDPNPPSGGEEASAEKQFVYNAMNYWYYWQGDVPELGDNYFDTDQAKQEYLMGFTDAEDVFGALLYEQEDDFSFFIDDYEEFQDEQDGIYAALGFNYGFIGFENSDRIVGYVRYVVPGSPADDEGLERLQLFTKVDGTDLNTSNYISLLTSNESHELTLADIEESDGGVSFPVTGTVAISSREVVEDPVHITKVIESNNTKIGYLMYNAFQGNSHQALNDAFSDLQAQGAEELVLDLRYNGGGAVITSQLLSSMISGLGSNDIFAEFDYNEKRSANDRQVYFLDEVPLQNENGDFETNSQGEFSNTEPINTLDLDHLYVLVSNSTASASEALINSLKSYIEVTIIGTQTIGKDEGSLTLYDAPAPYLDEDQANPDHKKAIQPIVLKIVNSNGDDYPDGFTPAGDDNISEITVENLQQKPGLGTAEEPLLARAITLITGVKPTKAPHTQSFGNDAQLQEVKVRGSLTSPRPFRQGMYVEPFMMPQNQ